MAVPDYQSVMLPLLRLAAEKGEEISTGEAVEFLAEEFGLTDEDLKEMLPSGIQPTFVNRVGWASTYMKKAGLLEATRRGFYRITPRGQDLLKKKPKIINVKLLIVVTAKLMNIHMSIEQIFQMKNWTNLMGLNITDLLAIDLANVS